jgi:glycosyltransferase involved in cell wall biosynthesis
MSLARAIHRRRTVESTIWGTTIDSAADRSPGARTVVLVAAHDEADRLAATLAALARAFPRAPMWVADDGSTDATAEIALAAGAHVVGGTRQVGKGGAVTRAAREALRHTEAPTDGARETSPHSNSKSIFVLCDGDLGDSAAELVALADTIARGDAEVAVAAFATRRGGGFGLALGFARWAVRRRCGLRTRAPISGQRALTRGALEDVLPFAPGFGLEIGMTVDAVRAGYRLRELDLDLTHRAGGLTPAGFLHRGRQLLDFLRVYGSRR